MEGACDRNPGKPVIRVCAGYERVCAGESVGGRPGTHLFSNVLSSWALYSPYYRKKICPAEATLTMKFKTNLRIFIRNI